MSGSHDLHPRLFVLLLCAVGLLGGSTQVPVRVEIDRDRGTFQASDPKRGAQAATISAEVAVGSPAFPTPPGIYRPARLILNPRWTPGEFARSNGAEKMPASAATPMGIAKIPLAEGGSIALHGGASPLILGKPVSLGCIRMADADMAGFIRWLDETGVLGPPVPQPNGEIIRGFLRPVRVAVQ